ncbi:serine/threonine-protein kinase [Streptomyces sp. NPDC088246]|uniref:serine/threonine-protein kinase n=1 Tax=Streptomyces sp. NPDC088246 TaxID=3365842 RepID=UPI0038080417
MDSADATRRDGAASGERSADATRRDRVPAQSAADGLLRLPSALAKRLTVVGELPHQGHEADILLVRDAEGTQLVAKVYRSGVRVAPEVWEKLCGLDARHVVRVHETGHSDGRDFELLEYLEGGSLEAFVSPAQAALPGRQLTRIVRQLAEAVEHLHSAGIVHSDLKPSNVLVRSRDPLDLVLADFGVSKSLDATSRFTQRVFGTVSYCSPEYLFGAQVSAPQDWWAVGVIVRQLATGKAPFDGLSEQAVRHQLATRPIDVADVADERMRLLCRGLLARDPHQRWGTAEVRSWLEGGSPEVAEEVAPAGATSGAGRRALAFKGGRHTEKATLARALATHWGAAARQFFAAMGSPENPSEGWRQLREWLTQFDDTEHDDVEGLVKLIDVQLTGKASPDVKLLRLLHWLDPAMPPVYRGKRLLPGDLHTLAQQATSAHDEAAGVRAARRMVDELRMQDLLPILASFGEEAHRLSDINRRWKKLVKRWDSGKLLEGVPQSGRTLLPGTSEAHALLLSTAAVPDEAVPELAARVDAVCRELDAAGERIDWFRRLVRTSDRTDPVWLLTVIGTGPAAIAQAQAVSATRKARKRKFASDLLKAAGLSALNAFGLLVIWLIGTIVTSIAGVFVDVFADGSLRGFDDLWDIAFLVLLVQFLCELALAVLLADGYRQSCGEDGNELHALFLLGMGAALGVGFIMVPAVGFFAESLSAGFQFSTAAVPVAIAAVYVWWTVQRARAGRNAWVVRLEADQ